MAIVEMNPMYNSFSGRIGNIVLYQVKENLFARRYVVPRNPDTEQQRKNRSLFAMAVRVWQALSADEKNHHNRIASRSRKYRNGYTLFISQYMKGDNEKTESVSESEGIYPVQTVSALPCSPFHKAIHSVASPLSLVYSYNKPALWRDSST